MLRWLASTRGWRASSETRPRIKDVKGQRAPTSTSKERMDEAVMDAYAWDLGTLGSEELR